MKLTVSALIGAVALLALAVPVAAQPIQYQSADGFNNTPVSAAAPLPVTGSLSVGGLAQGSTTSGQTGQLDMCATTTSAPTYTTAKTNPCSTDTAGNIRVIDANSAALLTAAQAAIPAGSAIIGKVGIDQTTPGTTNAVQPIAGTTGGVTPYTLTAAASTNATNVKASAGTLYHIGVYNNSATLAWVSFYNTAGTPTCGTSIVYQTMIPANTSGAGAVEDFSTGMAFSTGIGICVTTGIAGTGSVAATSYVVGLGYK